jgi:hypothetical protein
VSGFWAKFGDELANDPFTILALLAALFALATTPLAFAVLGRLGWFKARRGRVIQRPEFSSIVCGMMLVTAIPAIFAALVMKSRSFDRDRYEFDPNRTWSVLEQGREFQDLKQADAAVKKEMEHLALVRKNLVDNVKKLDESMLALRAVAGTSPAVAQRIPAVLQSLAGVRASVGVDGPQQLLDHTAPPADLRTAASAAPAASSTAMTVPGTATTGAPAATSPTAAPAEPANGLSPAQIEAELAAVPEPQRKIAAMLPLSGLPAGWEIGKSATHYLESFNAENLYEKIDGRAESFIQYGVKGMAYTFYHPAGDPSNELQLYIYEMASSLKALGKYGSEKPEEFQPVKIGSEGYSSAGSTHFYSGPYYTQIVSTADDPKFAAVALELAKQVAARQAPASSGAGAAKSAVAAPGRADSGTPAARGGPGAGTESPNQPAAAKPAAKDAKPAPAEVSPATFFALLPTQGRQGDPQYVAQDVFGYSFLSDVFMADYKDKDASWQGFLRPYRDTEEAKTMLKKYIEGVKKDGADVKSATAEGADEMVISNNIGLVDVIFRKGNTLAGANGGTNAAAAEAFARGLAKSLPATVPTLENAH